MSDIDACGTVAADMQPTASEAVTQLLDGAELLHKLLLNVRPLPNNQGYRFPDGSKLTFAQLRRLGSIGMVQFHGAGG